MGTLPEEPVVRLDDIPLFSMLRGRMGYLSAREKVIAENVANANTPGYVAKDIKAPQNGFGAALSGAQGSFAGGGSAVGMLGNRPGHMTTTSAGGASHNGFTPEKTPDSETRLDGNSVVLEEEMLKMAESRMAYDAAISFYQKSLNMLRMAARAPGR